MKKTFATLVTVLALVISGTTLNAQTKKDVKVNDSKIVWKGYKVTGSHEGTINLKSGSLTFKGDALTGGEFVVDMTSLESTNLSGNMKGKLDGHLKSDDFFGVENHPEATLMLTSVKATGKNAYNAKGKLTIKGKTNPVEFTIAIYGSKANATVKVDKSKYDVRYKYGSFFDNLGDKTIYDEFDLVVDLVF